MIKLLRYEIKKMLPIIIFTSAIISIIHFLTFVKIDHVHIYNPEYAPVAVNSPLVFITIYGMLLAFIAPLVFFYKMRRINVDHYYQLPIKKEKIYIIHYIVGLLFIIIPITICFIVNMIQIVTKPNLFDMKYAFIFFGTLILILITSYTIFSFSFTRCNNIIDGILNIFLYTILPFFIISSLLLIFNVINKENLMFIPENNGFYGLIYTPISKLTYNLNEAFLGHSNEFTTLDFISFGCWGAAAIILGILSIVLIKHDKAENSMQKSESWFGHKTIVPIITITTISFFTIDEYFILGLLTISIVSYGLYALAERNIKIGKKNLIVLGICIAVGVLLSIITGLY